ncbi:hypothetical protein BC834DRAFT_134421 [Gloeopeniophorella convolvens]|nr:hypothetical protein BC834DRAFT_134421 [Gloeopeniophorella convolvens]
MIILLDSSDTLAAHPSTTVYPWFDRRHRTRSRSTIVESGSWSGSSRALLATLHLRLLCDQTPRWLIDAIDSYHWSFRPVYRETIAPSWQAQPTFGDVGCATSGPNRRNEAKLVRCVLSVTSSPTDLCSTLRRLFCARGMRSGAYEQVSHASVPHGYYASGAPQTYDLIGLICFSTTRFEWPSWHALPANNWLPHVCCLGGPPGSIMRIKGHTWW